LRKTLSRLQEEVARAAGGLNGDLVLEGEDGIRLNPNVAASDVEAFLGALERARKARGAEQVGAAEEALVLRVPALLPDVPREAAAFGRKIRLYGWLDNHDWERGARRLNALGIEAMSLLGRAYRESGQYALRCRCTRRCWDKIHSIGALTRGYSWLPRVRAIQRNSAQSGNRSAHVSARRST
jgi:hypothetical protein